MNTEKLIKFLNQPMWQCPVTVEVKDVKIYIEVRGGIIQEISSNIENLNVEIFVVDYDDDNQQELPEGLYKI